MLNYSMTKKIVTHRFKTAQRRKNYFREWRKYRGMTLEEAAPLAGMTTGNLSAMERGTQGFTQDGLEGLANAYRTSPGWLLDVDPTKDESLIPIWDEAKPADRIKIVSIARTVVGKTGN